MGLIGWFARHLLRRWLGRARKACRHKDKSTEAFAAETAEKTEEGAPAGSDSRSQRPARRKESLSLFQCQEWVQPVVVTPLPYFYKAIRRVEIPFGWLYYFSLTSHHLTENSIMNAPEGQPALKRTPWKGSESHQACLNGWGVTDEDEVEITTIRFISSLHF